MNENQKVVLVKIADLKSHPELVNVYRKLDSTELFNRMRSDRTLLKLPVIDQDNHKIDGFETIDFLSQEDETEIHVLQIYVPPGQAALFRVKCHQTREKSLTEKHFELTLLEKFYPKRQGERSDLASQGSVTEKRNSRKELAAQANLSDSEVFRIKRFADKNLLSYADGGTIPKTALDKAASDEGKNNPLDKYIPIEPVSLEPGTCCKYCRQSTGRIIFTRATETKPGELVYRNQVSETEIEF